MTGLLAFNLKLREVAIEIANLIVFVVQLLFEEFNLPQPLIAVGLQTVDHPVAQVDFFTEPFEQGRGCSNGCQFRNTAGDAATLPSNQRGLCILIVHTFSAIGMHQREHRQIIRRKSAAFTVAGLGGWRKVRRKLARPILHRLISDLEQLSRAGSRVKVHERII